MEVHSNFKASQNFFGIKFLNLNFRFQKINAIKFNIGSALNFQDLKKKFWIQFYRLLYRLQRAFFFHKGRNFKKSALSKKFLQIKRIQNFKSKEFKILNHGDELSVPQNDLLDLIYFNQFPKKKNQLTEPILLILSCRRLCYCLNQFDEEFFLATLKNNVNFFNVIFNYWYCGEMQYVCPRYFYYHCTNNMIYIFRLQYVFNSGQSGHYFFQSWDNQFLLYMYYIFLQLFLPCNVKKCHESTSFFFFALQCKVCSFFFFVIFQWQEMFQFQ
eukprot:TRINITY_DN24571_c0_g3_i1.p1 TRINITY_DN24571_c0_g3~~TRINITY_DN24571_c0_g3_i1.p1  ORF type:complete len:271 (+),score=-10.84 TRINITY_DN24571_c0_g3_i1:3-815(+)